MARSLVVPHVPSPSVKVAIPPDVSEMVEAACGGGLSRDDAVELGLRAITTGAGSVASLLWEQYAAGHTQTPGDVIATLARAEIPDAVRGFRLSAPAPDRDPVPWPRPGIGADFALSVEDLWRVTRGLWRMRPAGISVIVALRLGRAIGVYRVAGWQQEPTSGRHYAVGGQVITETGRLVDVDTRTDAGPASGQDLTILQAVLAAPIVLPRGTAQPVVKLSAR